MTLNKLVSHQIVEKKLGIPGDYQYRAIRSRNFLQSNWHRNKWLVVEKLLDFYQPRSVLDLGTGSGNFELNFSSRLKNIVGIDYNDDALAFLSSELKKKQITNVKLVNQDITNLTKTHLGKFNLVLMVDVLEHIATNSISKLVANIRNSLVLRGKLIVITPNYAGLWPMVEKLVDRFTSLPDLEGVQHVINFDKKLLNHVFCQNSFKPVRSGTFNTFSYLIPSKYFSSRLCELEMKVSLLWGNLIYAVFES